MALYSDGVLLISNPYAASVAYVDQMLEYDMGCRYEPKNKPAPKPVSSWAAWELLPARPIPGAILIVLLEARHSINRERPEAINHHGLEFISGY
jgi:hypothetical protein